MSDAGEPGGSTWDAPNQQVVRPDQSGPWMEGDGGSGPEGSTDPQAADQQQEPLREGVELDEMTKDELLAKARELGVSPANHAMTKEELRQGIDDKLAEG